MEEPFSNRIRVTGDPNILMIFLSHSWQILRYYVDYATTVSFQVLRNSSFKVSDAPPPLNSGQTSDGVKGHKGFLKYNSMLMYLKIELH
jgi:hypothetical protein